MATQNEIIKFIFQGDDKVSGKMKTIAVGLGAVATAAIAAGTALFEFAKNQAPMLDVATAFDSVTKSAGLAGDAVLESMQKATAGMVPAADLMKTFNTAANLVGTKTARLMVDGLEDISKIALATGQDVDYLFNSLVTGVGRESKMILDNLGLTQDLGEIKRQYAESIGIEVEALTKEQQQLALTEAALAGIRERASALPEVSDSATGAFARLDATLADMKLRIAEEVVPTLIPLLEQLTALAIEWLPQLIPLVQDLAEAMTWLARGGLREVGEKLDKKISPAITRVIGKVSDFFWKIHELGKKLHWLGGQIPPWLIPGSPTPLETGLVGISKATKKVTNDYKVLASKLKVADAQLAPSFRDLNPEIGMAERAGMNNFSVPGTAGTNLGTVGGGGGGGGGRRGGGGGGMADAQVIRLLQAIKDGVEDLPDEMYQVNQELVRSLS